MHLEPGDWCPVRSAVPLPIPTTGNRIADHDRREFLCERRGWALFSGGIDRMFYTIVGENTLVVVGIRAVAVAPLQVRPSFVAETNHRTRSTSTATGCSMFRTGAAPKGAIQIVTVLSPFLAIQNLVQPPTLVECALMSLQDRHCKEDGTGARSGGLTPEDVEKMVGYRGSSLIPV